MIKGKIALFLLVYSAALAAEPGVSDAPCVAAVKQMCDRQVVGQGENGDWAFIGRYRKTNAELIGARTRPNVVFIGDSITEFWAKQLDFARESARVGRRISGQSSPQILLRFSSRRDQSQAARRPYYGRHQRYCRGHWEIQGYISNIVELAQLHGIQVVLASIPPAADFFWHTGLNPAPRICALNNWLKAYALDQKLTYVDYWSVLSAPDGGMRRDFSDDGVHPNVNGYRAMEPLAEAAITKALQ